MADDNFYMKQALMEARAAASAGEVPVGAVVVCRDRIVARGHNLTETLNDVLEYCWSVRLNAIYINITDFLSIFITES